ncbi:MAG: hypothetical protein H6838_07160 [Planctomycetes bacterium]|nr:hypothetical protein [Planctomycetota bacterium]
MSESSKPFPIDPKELAPAAGGFAIGIGILVFFILLAIGMGLTLLVDKGNIPMQ